MTDSDKVSNNYLIYSPGGYVSDPDYPWYNIGEILDTRVTGVSSTLSRSNSQSVIGGGSMAPTPTKDGNGTSVYDVLKQVATVLSDGESK